jgi:hypothetical protein
MNFESREAYCLEILANESEKLSQNISFTESNEISEWDSVNTAQKPHKAHRSVIIQTKTPRLSRKLTSLDRSFDKSTAYSGYKSQEGSLVTLSSCSPPVSPARISENTGRVIKVHSIGFNPFTTRINRRATTTKKLHRHENLLLEESSIKSFSPCKCVVSILKTKSYHCSPNCINKLLTTQHKEYYSGKLSLMHKLKRIMRTSEKSPGIRDRAEIKNSRSKESVRITSSPRAYKDPRIQTNPWLIICANKLELPKQKSECPSSPNRSKRVSLVGKRKVNNFF